ncbi:hypothetical protein BGX28_006994 [Mortierella sp. GBA30]|nr:hypothetical protein BGX28_006994 [Mortierella sp. GBA30]
MVSQSATVLDPSAPNKRAATLSPPTSTCTNLLSIAIHPSIFFRKRVHEQIPEHKILTVGTDSYNMMEDDFWCLQCTDACIRLIQQNPCLRSLTETWDNMSPFHRIRFTQLLCREPNSIVKMHLTKWEVCPEELNLLIENSSCLEHLRFSTLVVNNSSVLSLDATVSTTKAIQSKTTVLNLRQLKALILSCTSFRVSDLRIEGPKLQTLNVSFSHINSNPVSHHSAQSLSTFALYTSSVSSQDGYCQYPCVVWNTPRLEKLIWGRTDHQFGTSSLLDSAYALRTVSFTDYDIESRLVEDVLARQATQLESIRLACFSGITARDLKTILTRCPNLKNFYAPEIMVWAGDLVPISSSTGAVDAYQLQQQQRQYDDEWVCKKLERLSIYVCLESSATLEDLTGLRDHHHPTSTLHLSASMTSTADTQQRQPQNELTGRVRDAFLNQLARLICLKHLDLSGEHVEKVDHVQVGVPLTLDNGIQELAMLKELEHVVVTGWFDDVGYDEVTWMKASWPKLNHVTLLKTNTAGEVRLQDMFARTWPGLTVHYKERNKRVCCPRPYFF